jgi:hypothetical protein
MSYFGEAAWRIIVVVLVALIVIGGAIILAAKYRGLEIFL